MDLDSYPNTNQPSPPQPTECTESRSNRVRRYLRRIKTALRLRGSSDELIDAGNSPCAETTTSRLSARPITPTHVLVGVTTSSESFSELPAEEPLRDSSEQISKLPPTLYRAEQQQDEGSIPLSPEMDIGFSHPLDYRMQRAANLFWRYGIELEHDDGILLRGQDPIPATDLRRVEKPIVVRVHRHCHRCSLEIGHRGVCVNCGHKICKRCQRYPENKPTTSPSTTRDRKRKASSPIRSETLNSWLAQAPPSATSKHSLTRISPSRETFVTKRRRMMCHQCSTMFLWSEKICQNCNHIMCNECLRGPTEVVSPIDPSFDQPVSLTLGVRERMLKRPRLRSRHTCENCNSSFLERPGTCANCGHLSYDNSPKIPSKRDSTSNISNPSILESLRRRIGSLSSSSVADQPQS